MPSVVFKGCKFLDFESKYPGCRKVPVSDIYQTVVCWDRYKLHELDPELPQFVQFCKKRGRLNHQIACCSIQHAVCNDYEPIQFIIELEVEDADAGI